MKPINSLTATRGFAAILVVIFHYGCTVFPFSMAEHFFRSGNLAVNYFFVLSGFVMYLTYSNRAISYGDFIRRRFARIYPAYLLAIVLAILPVVYLWLWRGTQPEPKFVTGLVLNVSLLQAYIPGYALTINSPGWSLSIEMFFYILFPLLLLFQKQNARSFLWLAAGVYLLSQAAHFLLLRYLYPVYPSPQHDFVYYQPLFHLNLFLAGMCGGYLVDKVKVKLPALVLFVVTVVVINYMPGHISMHNGLLAPLFLLLIIAIARRDPPALRIRPLVFLGEISYSVYILQEPVHYYVYHLNENYWHLSATTFFYTYLSLLLVIAACSYKVVEKPLRKWWNRDTPVIRQPL